MKTTGLSRAEFGETLAMTDKLEDGYMNRLIFAIGIFVLFVGFAVAGPGDLDSTFGTGGVVTQTFGIRTEASGLAIQPDAKIVVAGKRCVTRNSECDFILTRLMKDGAPDNSFGSRGLVVSKLLNENSKAVAVDAAGKIYAAGVSRSGGHAVLERRNANGSLDHSFGQQGRFVLNITDSKFDSIFVMSDGRILAAGTSLQLNHGNDVLVAMINSHGHLVASFGQRGTVLVDKQSDDYASSVVVDSAGRILVGATTAVGGYDGRFSGAFFILRFTTNGKPDNSFGDHGQVVLKVTGYFDSTVKIASGSNLMIGGSSDIGLGIIAELNHSGRKAAFGRNGIVRTKRSLNFQSIDMAVQLDGKILLCGYGFGGGNPGRALVTRFLPDGSADPAFDRDGSRAIGFGQQKSNAAGCSVTGHKLIVLGTTSAPGTDNVIALARLLLD
jgi:uncharacterized delta-60 repeat protein